ncbi:hypothetical protein P775_00970 [Puniceibacterium antarcticum]|uniref:Uncharacterized protein n=2 Tax=Puniceibacterium antarcticum TaxID=1206336 RepID=A0A2G8RLF8_9RHOB|nr:hypothetical protein P775_00970 [Puniceibacterium antarcticum]
MVNATPVRITSVQFEYQGKKADLLENIAPYEVAAPPDYIMGLYQSAKQLSASSVMAYALTVNFETGPSFTLTLNLSTASQGSEYLTFYLMARGIFVVNDVGDPRAVSWV